MSVDCVLQPKKQGIKLWKFNHERIQLYRSPAIGDGVYKKTEWRDFLRPTCDYEEITTGY